MKTLGADVLSQPTFCLLERLRATQKASIGFGASYLATAEFRTLLQ